MKTFPPERIEDVRAELEKMKFDHVERLLSRIDETEDPNDPAIKACLFAETPISDTGMADIFIVIGEKPDGSWYINAILAWVQMATTRTEEGFMDVQKGYLWPEEPLPTVDQISQDVKALVQFEEYVDFFFLKNALDRNLHQIGFQNSSEMLRSVRQSDNLFYLHTAEKIGGEGPNGGDSVHFEFVVMADKQQETAKLMMIKAFVSAESPNADAIKEQTETAFYPLIGQFPMKLSGQFALKKTMIDEVLSKLNPDKRK